MWVPVHSQASQLPTPLNDKKVTNKECQSCVNHVPVMCRSCAHRKAGHEGPVLHQSSTGGGPYNELVVVERVDLEQRVVRAGADVDLCRERMMSELIETYSEGANSQVLILDPRSHQRHHGQELEGDLRVGAPQDLGERGQVRRLEKGGRR